MRFCKHSHVNTLDLLANWHTVLLIEENQNCSNKVYEVVFFKDLLTGHSLFFIGNSRLNCRIIESIFDTSLVYLHACTLVQSFMSWESAASNFAIKFSFGYLENSLLQILLPRIFKKGRELFALNPMKNLSKSQRLSVDFSWKIRENKGRLLTNFVCITFAQYCIIHYLQGLPRLLFTKKITLARLPCLCLEISFQCMTKQICYKTNVLRCFLAA